MSSDWGAARKAAIQAAETTVGSAWKSVQNGVAAQIDALISTAQYIQANQAAMTPDEYSMLMDQQKAALQNVLTGYQAIGYATAQNAVAAVVNALVDAVPGILGLSKI